MVVTHKDDSNRELAARFNAWASGSQHDYCPLADHSERTKHKLCKFFREEAITTCPSCAFGIRFKAMTEDITDPLPKGRWQHLWLKHCLSHETDYLFIVLQNLKDDKNGIEINREQDVKELLAGSLLKPDGPLDQLALGGILKQYYLAHCEDWFLRRYNKKDALWCYLNRRELSQAGRWDTLLDRLKFFFPRIIGSIIIGYLPLLFTSESWHVAASAPWGINLLLPLAALVLSYLYFFMEVRNNLEPGSREYTKRAGHIFRYSLAISTFIGLCLLPIIAVYLPSDDVLAGISGKWPFVWILSCRQNFLLFLKILLFSSPLALLIGIFVQILWEEKPVTHPL